MITIFTWNLVIKLSASEIMTIAKWVTYQQDVFIRFWTDYGQTVHEEISLWMLVSITLVLFALQ